VTAKTSPTDPSKISCNLDLSTMCDWGEDIDFELLVIKAGQLDIEDILTEALEK
jgi:hypothetical protein